MMIDEFWIYSWGLVGIPGKDINVLSKELYQLFSLLMRQLGSNLKNFFGLSPTTTFTRSSHFASSAGLLMDKAGDFNCYKPFSPWAEDSVSGLCWMAATIYCLAKSWSPSISLIWAPDGYLTSGAEWKKLLPKCEAKVWQQLLYRESMHPWWDRKSSCRERVFNWV